MSGPGTPYVAVIGPGDAPDGQLRLAEEVGALLAEAGAVLVSGGLGGVMAASCAGARAKGGTTIGLLPGRARRDGNPHLSLALPTGLGEMRNALVVTTADALIAVGGSWGTLSEIALAMRTGKPLVALAPWPLDPPVPTAATPAEAVQTALAALETGPST